MDALLYNSISLLVLLILLLSLRNTYNLNECKDLLYHILDHVCPFDEYEETEHREIMNGVGEGKIIVLDLNVLNENTNNNGWEEWDRE